MTPSADSSTYANPIVQPHGTVGNASAPFDEEWVLIRKSERIQLTAEANFWKAQHQRAVLKIATLEGALALARAGTAPLSRPSRGPDGQ